MQIAPRIGIIADALSQDPRHAIARSRQLGLAGLMFDVCSPRLSLPELSGSGRREFKNILSSHDQQLIALQANLEGRGFAPSTDIERMIARVDRAMETAAGLGSPLVCVDLGPLPEPARTAAPRPAVDIRQAGAIIIPTAAEIAAARPQPAQDIPPDTAFEASVDAALVELGRRADRYSAVVAFHSDLSSFAALERALRKAACPWFGIVLDPVAILRDPWGTDQVFDHFGGEIRLVRARDASVGHDRRTKPAAIGRGDVDWPQLLALLREAGYDAWLVIDPLELPDRSAAASSAIAELKEAAL